ncbi:MAG: hypothetical protein Q7T44_05515 [Parvibaculum sp.]|nr:hypothetical protein [Parvibaculum sp.]
MASDRTATLFMRTGALLACLALTPSASANIFGPDDRRLIATDDNLSAVGLIVCDDTTRRPTATLIKTNGSGDSQIIISVAHAFLSRQNKPLAPCAFWPQGRPQDATPIAFTLLGTGEPIGNWNDDWAVALLARPLPARYQALETLTLSGTDANEARASGARFSLAGHNGESGPMMVSTDCGPMRKINADINRFDERAYNHDCDMMPGWSGGPLMLERDGKRYVIAVNATELNALVTRAGETYDGAYNANTAVRIDGAFLDAITRLARDPHFARTGPGPATCRIHMPAPIESRRC